MAGRCEVTYCRGCNAALRRISLVRRESSVSSSANKSMILFRTATQIGREYDMNSLSVGCENTWEAGNGKEEEEESTVMDENRPASASTDKSTQWEPMAVQHLGCGCKGGMEHIPNGMFCKEKSDDGSISSHDLRGTFATSLVSDGGDVGAIFVLNFALVFDE